MRTYQGAGFPDRLRDLRRGGHPSIFRAPAAAACRCAARPASRRCKGGREQIVITEIPYNVNRADLVERIAELVNEKGPHRHQRRPRRVGREHARGHRAEARRQSRRSSSTISTSTPRWSRPSPSTCWPSITAGRSCCRSRSRSPATSSTGARSSCAARASLAQGRGRAETARGLPHRPRATSTTSSGSSATRAIATKPRSSCSRFDWTRQARSSRFGILIRDRDRA